MKSLNRRVRHPDGSIRSCIGGSCEVVSIYSITTGKIRGNILVKCVLAQLTADTRLLVTTEWHLVMESVVGVDPHGASLEGVRCLDGSVEVLGVHSGGKTVGSLVGGLDDLIPRLELADGADRAEDLLLHDLHVLSDVGEDGGLDEVTLVTLAVAADLDCSACILAGLDVVHDAVELDLRDLWALEGVLGEWVADDVLLCSLLESLDEVVIDALLYVDTRASAAALAVVEEDTEVDP